MAAAQLRGCFCCSTLEPLMFYYCWRRRCSAAATLSIPNELFRHDTPPAARAEVCWLAHLNRACPPESTLITDNMTERDMEPSQHHLQPLNRQVLSRLLLINIELVEIRKESGMDFNISWEQSSRNKNPYKSSREVETCANLRIKNDQLLIKKKNE